MNHTTNNLKNQPIRYSTEFLSRKEYMNLKQAISVLMPVIQNPSLADEYMDQEEKKYWEALRVLINFSMNHIRMIEQLRG